MENSEAWERKLLHTFSGYKFDWRWESLGFLTSQLVDMWGTLAKYQDEATLLKDGQLDHKATNHLCRALTNDPEDLPAVELMVNATLRQFWAGPQCQVDAWL